MTEPIPRTDRPGLSVLGRITSINVRKVLWVADELGLAVHHEPWGDPGWPLRTDAFRALNPNALVPVLVDDGWVLWESHAIARYLCDRHGGAAGRALLPADPVARAPVDSWLDWQATALNTAWRHAFMHRVRRSPDFDDPRAVAASVAEWNRHMAMLEGQLQASGGASVLPGGFSLADIVLGLGAHRWAMTPMSDAERPALPRVQAWLAALRQRPAAARHLSLQIA